LSTVLHRQLAELGGPYNAWFAAPGMAPRSPAPSPRAPAHPPATPPRCTIALNGLGMVVGVVAVISPDSQDPDQPRLDRATSIAFGCLLAGLGALLTGALVVGIRRGLPSDFTALDTAHLAVLVLAMWALAGECFFTLSQRDRARRIGRRCGLTAWTAMGVFLAGMWLKAAFAPADEAEWFTVRGYATLLALVPAFPLLGVALCLSERPVDIRNAWSVAGYVFFWPVMLLLVSPLTALVLLIVLGGAAFANESIGARIGHPLAGVFCGLALLFAVLLCGARLASRHRAEG
jgi:hypothetical protein